MDLSNILAVSGKPDLNEMISRTKNGAIVKNLVTGQKFPVFASNTISQLSEIRMYTTNDEKPLEDILSNMYNVLEAKPTSFDPKSAESSVLFEWLEKVLPDYDKDRVHASDAKKLFCWYNILLAADKLTPTEENDEEKAQDEASQDKQAPAMPAQQHKTPAPKQPAPKANTQAKSAPKRTTTAKKAI